MSEQQPLAQHDNCDNKECHECKQKFNLYDTYNMYLNVSDVFSALGRSMSTPRLRMKAPQTIPAISQELCEKKLSSTELLCTGPKRHRLVFNKYFRRGKSTIYEMKEKVKNRVGICSLYGFLFARMLWLEQNPKHNYQLFTSNVEAPTSQNLFYFDLDNMTATVAEDIAIFALGGEYLFTVQQYIDCPVLLRRLGLLRRAYQVAEQQIRTFWPQFIKTTQNGEEFVDVAWYLLLCSAVQRTYGINVLTGDGSQFIVAYAQVVNDQITVSDCPVVTHQSYYYFADVPKGVEIYDMTSEDDTGRRVHGEIMAKDGTTSVFVNCQNKLQTTCPLGQNSPLLRVCKALTKEYPLIRQGKKGHYKDFQTFKFVRSTLKNVVGFYKLSEQMGKFENFEPM